LRQDAGDIGAGSGAWSERSYRKLKPHVAHLDDAAQDRWLYFKLWPNTAFDIYADQIDFMQFLPISATETLIREISYTLPDDRREMRATRYLDWRTNRQVNAEDTTLVARLQAGMASRSYAQGPLGASEACLRAFAGTLRAAIPEARQAQRPQPAWFGGQSGSVRVGLAVVYACFSAAMLRMAFSKASTGWPPVMRYLPSMTTAGTALMPCSRQKRSSRRTSSA
jgi:hypothetical protein